MVQRAEFGFLDSGNSDRWYVTDGVVALGPVSFEILTRSVANGKLPETALIRHESWQVWRTLTEIGALSDGHRVQKVRSLAELSQSLDERASGPQSVPPPPPSSEELQAPESDFDVPSRPSLRPVAVDPVGVLASARDFDEALLLTLSTCVRASSSEVGLLHRDREDLDGTITTCAHGGFAELLLGEKLLADDPALAAARTGQSVIAEPHPGEIGRYLTGRLSRCLEAPLRGAAMVPLILRNQLVAIVEIGRTTRPFRAREVARVEDVVEALAERIVVMGWLE